MNKYYIQVLTRSVDLIKASSSGLGTFFSTKLSLKLLSLHDGFALYCNVNAKY